MSNGAVRHGNSRHLAFSAALVLVAAATFLISPFLTVVVAAAAALHAHFVGLTLVRNVLLVLVAVALVLAFLSGTGGGTDSESFGI